MIKPLKKTVSDSVRKLCNPVSQYVTVNHGVLKGHQESCLCHFSSESVKLCVDLSDMLFHRQAVAKHNILVASEGKNVCLGYSSCGIVMDLLWSS